MREIVLKYLTIIVIFLIATSCIYATIIVLKDIAAPYQSKTTELTIEYLWVEDNEYYFADSNGNVYQLGNYRDVRYKIVYNDMPKQRFERLNKSSKYEIKYISGRDYWISISEKEI